MGREIGKKLICIIFAIGCLAAAIIGLMFPVLPASPFFLLMFLCIFRIANRRISDIFVIDDIIKENVWIYGSEIITSEEFLQEKNFSHHGNISVYEHSIQVARYSVFLADKMKKNIDRQSLIRGALLHDYYLYDWHIRDKSHRLHGLFHAKTSYNNASRDFDINQIEKDIILRHMFPLNLIPPKTQEGWLVCLADKIVSIEELSSKKEG